MREKVTHSDATQFNYSDQTLKYHTYVLLTLRLPDKYVSRIRGSTDDLDMDIITTKQVR